MVQFEKLPSSERNWKKVVAALGLTAVTALGIGGCSSNNAESAPTPNAIDSNSTETVAPTPTDDTEIEQPYDTPPEGVSPDEIDLYPTKLETIIPQKYIDQAAVDTLPTADLTYAATALYMMDVEEENNKADDGYNLDISVSWDTRSASSIVDSRTSAESVNDIQIAFDYTPTDSSYPKIPHCEVTMLFDTNTGYILTPNGTPDESYTPIERMPDSDNPLWVFRRNVDDNHTYVVSALPNLHPESLREIGCLK